MRFWSKSSLPYASLCFLFILVFTVIAILYTQHSNAVANKQFQYHASVISNDVWALNQEGIKAYLRLAANTSHYKTLHVAIPGENNYLQVTSSGLHGLVKVLHQGHLITTKERSADIFYGDLIIGKLTGTQYVRVIIPLFNILIFLLLLLLTSCFILYLNQNRQDLQEEVRERTENLRLSERRFHDLVNLLPEMVLETDLDGKILYVNHTAKETLGLDKEELSSNFFDLVAKTDQLTARNNFQDALQGEKSNLIELTIKPLTGRELPVLVRSAAMYRNNKVNGARMIAVDISERRMLEEQLHRDQKMKAIGLMAGGVAHDLNNILSGIISYPELLLLELSEDSPMRRPLEAIHCSGLEAANVVADLLTVARGIAPTREIADLNTLVHNYLQSPDFLQLRNRYPLVRVTTDLVADPPPISCSPIHVRKCLMNLITNGFEAIEGRGALHVSTKIEAFSSHNTREDLAPGNYSLIIIADTGSGINKEDLERIFEPFYTKKVMGRSGTGLGLAVVWNTMRDHGGRVWVDSDSSGTIFTLVFPSVNAACQTEATSGDSHDLRGNGERILVVDDELRQREIAAELLLSLNYRVETAASGDAAIDYCRNFDTDLVLLDMLMPPGRNGRSTYEKILHYRPQQKAIIVSGFAEDDDVRVTLAMGAAMFLSKPYTLQQLGSAIRQTIQQC
jgi:two-component system cell cycle sensor histidine kinase/response regulator CckA